MRGNVPESRVTTILYSHLKYEQNFTWKFQPKGIFIHPTIQFFFPCIEPYEL